MIFQCHLLLVLVAFTNQITSSSSSVILVHIALVFFFWLLCSTNWYDCHQNLQHMAVFHHRPPALVSTQWQNEAVNSSGEYHRLSHHRLFNLPLYRHRLRFSRNPIPSKIPRVLQDELSGLGTFTRLSTEVRNITYRFWANRLLDEFEESSLEAYLALQTLS